jgi:hypothetical protein
MLVLVVLLLLALAIGFILGYGVRELISRRRRFAARFAAPPERFSELAENQTLRLE